MKTFFMLFLGLLSTSFLYAQDEGSVLTDSQSEISDSIISLLEYSDIGFIWTGEGYDNSRLGFISDDYQRIRVRFLSVIQNYDNPFEYFVYGKSKVKEQVCEFQGSVYITEAGVVDVDEDEYPGFTRAFVSGNYVLYEDPGCIRSGIYSGNFLNRIYFDKNGDVYYDDLNLEEKDYENSLFRGSWFNYDTGEEMICNWGDYRIPGAEELDVGAGEFHPSFRYLENGWKEYLEEQDNSEVQVWWK